MSFRTGYNSGGRTIKLSETTVQTSRALVTRKALSAAMYLNLDPSSVLSSDDFNQPAHRICAASAPTHSRCRSRTRAWPGAAGPAESRLHRSPTPALSDGIGLVGDVEFDRQYLPLDYVRALDRSDRRSLEGVVDPGLLATGGTTQVCE